MAGKGNGAPGQTVNGFGTFRAKEPRETICENFVITLHEWCERTPPGGRGSFENLYFKNLEKRFPKFSNAMGFRREFPVIYTESFGVGKVKAADLVDPGNNQLAPLANAMLTAYTQAQGKAWPWGRKWKNVRNSAYKAFRKLQPDIFSHPTPGFPDGLSQDGRHWLEIKGPRDTLTPHQRKQHKAYRSQKSGTVHMADCSCPGANCKDGNNCPEQYPPEPPRKQRRAA